jgi:hypothetical protein
VDSVQNSPEAQRRSSRIRAQIPLRITSLDTEVRFSEQCHTVIVNPQGCGLRLSAELPAGIQVLLDELPNGLKVTGRVANAVPLGIDKKYWLVGVALDQPGNVWGIQPAPADWGESTAKAALTTAAAPPISPAVSAQKRNEWPYSQFSQHGEFHPGRK